MNFVPVCWGGEGGGGCYKMRFVLCMCREKEGAKNFNYLVTPMVNTEIFSWTQDEFENFTLLCVTLLLMQVQVQKNYWPQPQVVSTAVSHTSPGGRVPKRLPPETRIQKPLVFKENSSVVLFTNGWIDVENLQFQSKSTRPKILVCKVVGEIHFFIFIDWLIFE